MLYLMRKIGESIIINDDIEVKVVEVKGRSVKLGFEFPTSSTVLRKEIHDRIVEENLAAAAGDVGMDFSEIVSRISGGDDKKQDEEDPKPKDS